MAIAPTTWNSSDRTAMNLSNGNLTAVSTAAGGVRSVFSASTGKWYWEVLFSAGSFVGIGIANASATLATVWSNSTNAALAQNGTTLVNNVSQSGAGILISVGTTVCIAMDLDVQRVWFRSGAAGNWNNSGTANPATNIGGLNIAVLGAPLMALDGTNIGSNTCTANFGTTAFVGTVPSNFTVGFGPTGAGAVQAYVMVLA